MFYFSIKYETAEFGKRFVGVQCDHCGCEYYYELARSGTGTATAHYGTFTDAAKKAAEERSKTDLGKRLSDEAELVPCPECNWINHELVRGYRRGRHLWLEGMAYIVAGIGIVASLVGSWFIHIGPERDRHLFPYFLYVYPLTLVAFAIATHFFCEWLRGLIRPNHNFPLLPQLPAGTPAALIRNPDTGELRPAKPPEEQVSGNREWQIFQLGRNAFAPVCCECLQSAEDQDTYVRHEVAPSIMVEIPRCADCAARAKQSERRIWWLTAVNSWLVGGALLYAFVDPDFFWFLFVAYFVIVWMTTGYLAIAMTLPARIRLADRSRGIIKLRFHNVDYRPFIL